jgi:hypothetical protein
MRNRWTYAAGVGICAAALLGCGGEREADDERDVSLVPAESVAALQDEPQPETPAAAEATPEQSAPPRRTEPAPSPPPTRRQPAPAPVPRTLPAGTVIELAARDSISSRVNQAGDPIVATATADITDESGRVLIPAGAVFSGVIEQIAPAPGPGGQGTLVLAFNEVTVNGRTYGMEARADTLGTEQHGRGISTGDAAKVGVGAAAGAIAGRILGGNRRGTIIGGVVGAAAGAGIAAATKDQDIVLPAGELIRLVLQAPMELERNQ